MKLNQLPKTTSKSRKRLGRGYGSGVGGHTSTRGTKGQHARSSLAIWFEGGQLPFIRRFPFQRGKGRFQSLSPTNLGLNVEVLNQFPANSKITPKTLIDAGLISQKDASRSTIKILGGGKLSVALEVDLPVTKQAHAKIEKAGGKVNRGQTS